MYQYERQPSENVSRQIFYLDIQLTKLLDNITMNTKYFIVHKCFL